VLKEKEMELQWYFNIEKICTLVNQEAVEKLVQDQ